ncbi:MAG TPA: C25 family cysteine peptidase, partial [Thermoanaerobaculia bacterium]|nr:C25 family cysteine peptidase [Thermoanaerobaculia bacterium]
GAGAVYAGNAAVGQGSITSQPAVGGTGDVVWNPGTLAAGATSILTYQVDISPTSAGQRILATSTPASGNGTRARFVDETGNTTQARATYLAGPICELGVTEGLLTEAVVASFRARQEGNAVVLEWRTASEAGTAGFYVYGRDILEGADTEPFQLHENLLPGLLHAPQGGTYRFVDESASPRVPREYVLIEVEADGRLRPHGPFRPAVEWGNEWDKSALEPGLAYDRVAHPAKAAPVSKRAPARGTATAGSPRALRVAVRESGLYRISSADMAGLFEISRQDMEKKVAEGKLSLTRGGQPVAWYPFFDGSAAAGPRAAKGAQGIYFYGQALDSLYSLDNVYRLDLGGSGLLMQVAAVSGPGAAPPAASFAEVGRSERDLLPATAVAPDAESDYWFWDFLQAGDATYGRKTYRLDAPGLTSGTTASLTVRLFGATTTGVTGEHRVSVSVNGTPVGETSWQGIAPRSATFAVDPALLLETGNQVEATALLDAGVPYSIFYIDSFELGYPRAHRAAGDVLAFTGSGAAASVSGLSAAPVLLDVSVPARPRWLTGATVEPDAASGAGFRAGFAAAAAGARYLATGPGGVKTPDLRAWRDEGLAASTNGADYLVITTAGLGPAAQRLANYRAAQGLESLVVDVEAVYDEFNAGLPSPHALRAFLAHARRSWRKAPRYVVLAGAGSIDYRDLLGYGGGLVPPLLVRSSGGLFVSDNAIADVAGGAGGDGLPEMAIGRLPVRTPAELNAYIDKLGAAEAAGVAGPEWRSRVLMLSDAPDRGADFAADNEKVAGRLPDAYSVDRIDLGAEPLEAARGRLFSGLARGAALVNYLGHGGLDRLTGAGLLASADIPAMAAGPRLPVLTAMTCTVNRFGVPGVSSLGEVLVRQPGRGAAAVWSPSGLSIHGEAVLLAERFYQTATDPSSAATATRLGDLVLRSLGDLKTLGGSRSMLDVYNLLGDPALLVQQPVPAPPTGAGGGGE